MDRTQYFMSLASWVKRASEASDWAALVELEERIATALPRGDGNDLTESERQALASLGRAHAEAREHCQQETVRVKALLRGFQAHQEGWLAYASQDREEVE